MRIFLMDWTVGSESFLILTLESRTFGTMMDLLWLVLGSRLDADGYFCDTTFQDLWWRACFHFHR